MGADGTVTLSVPLHVHVSLGTAGPAGGARVAASGPARSPADDGPADESLSFAIDRDYSTREGYDPEFLGRGDAVVPLPRLTAAQLADAARLTNVPAGTDPHELRYHHFSVILNGVRRLAFLTAVNIDGAKEQEGTKFDSWNFDRRLPKDVQSDNTLYYNNAYDRGHLVRRLDPVWGRTRAIAVAAHDDTYHWTNCAPQHKDFNQPVTLWQGIERFLLDRATGSDQRLTVFTGPVFADDDPWYRRTDDPRTHWQIPRQYWKVAALLGPDGAVRSLGFVASQAALIETIPSFDTATETAGSYQLSVAAIEELTGFDFGHLAAADVEDVASFAVPHDGGAGAFELTGTPLTNLDQIRLPAGVAAGRGRDDKDSSDGEAGDGDRQRGDGGAAPETGTSFGVSAGPDGKTRVSGTRLAYYLLAYDADGRERTDHPAGVIGDRIRTELIHEPITDVFVFSHGWSHDVPAAEARYAGWLTAIADRDADRAEMMRRRPTFRPLLVGIHWPSLVGGDETLTPAGGASFALGTDGGGIDEAVETLTGIFGKTKKVRDDLRAVLTAAEGEPPETLPEPLVKAYRRLDKATKLPVEGVGAAPGADREPFDPQAIYADARRETVASEAGAGGAVSFGGLSWGSVLAPLRTLSFWTMKDRARRIGETGVHDFLRTVQDVTVGRDVRVHLAGHSFGGAVLTAALAGPPDGRPLNRPVDSLTIIQGAFSHWSLCRSIPADPDRAGYFHRVTTDALVRGPDRDDPFASRPRPAAVVSLGSVVGRTDRLRRRRISQIWGGGNLRVPGAGVGDPRRDDPFDRAAVPLRRRDGPQRPGRPRHRRRGRVHRGAQRHHRSGDRPPGLAGDPPRGPGLRCAARDRQRVGRRFRPGVSISRRATTVGGRRWRIATGRRSRIERHGSTVIASISRGSDERTSQPSSVTRTSSSRRIPPTPGR